MKEEVRERQIEGENQKNTRGDSNNKTQRLDFVKYQKGLEQDYCFPSTHILAATDFLQYNIHKASQDSGVVKQISGLSH